jgi:molybdopterin molybdotransferase
MDGYAFAFASWQAGRRQFTVQDLQTAGQSPRALRQDDLCIEVMTGAKLPMGCDVVVRYEDTKREGSQVFVEPNLSLSAFGNIHRQGDDCGKGQIFAPSRMNPPVAAIAASFGIHTLQVQKPWRVAILGTGDELVPVDQQPLDYQIRASNIHALRMAVEQRGHTVSACRILRDDRSLILSSVERALDDCDLILLSGAVSAGSTDFVPGVLADLGVRKIFHKIAQKPGKPLWFGRSERGTSVFGLPGNPVSSLICAYRYVLPYLELREAVVETDRPYAELASPLPKNRSLTHFTAVTVRYTKEARIIAEAVKQQGSGDFASLSRTMGFLEIPGEDEAGFDPQQRHFPLYLW